MKILLAVQGLGRGHLTQALAVQQWARRQSHSVVAVVVGSNQSQNLPASFESSFDVAPALLPSPSFAWKEGRRVALASTLWQIIRHAKHFKHSLASLQKIIHATQPDLLFNFFEPLLALHLLVH